MHIDPLVTGLFRRQFIRMPSSGCDLRSLIKSDMAPKSSKDQVYDLMPCIVARQASRAWRQGDSTGHRAIFEAVSREVGHSLGTTQKRGLKLSGRACAVSNRSAS